MGSHAVQQHIDLHVNELFWIDDLGRGRASAHGVLPHHQKDHGCDDEVYRLLKVHLSKLTALNATRLDAANHGSAWLDDFFLVKLCNFRKVLRLAHY